MKKILRCLIGLWLAACLPLGLYAQTYDVKGQVKDAETRRPLPYASVQLLTADSVLYAIGLADSAGVFRVPCDSAGRYVLRLSAVGYDALGRNVTFSATQSHVDLGELFMKVSAMARELDAATIEGKASPLTIRKDTFVYAASAMNVEDGALLSALIAQMPGVRMDKDGNLTWQGKTIESLLVNGRKFFGGDIKTALMNLPAEMVANLKVYDKKSDMAEKTGVDDGERTTVIDVGIKKEYQGAWLANADAGGGYEDRWTGRAFLSRFSDRLRVAVAGSANNLNGNAQVDENGNWRNSGFRMGWSTFRSASSSVSWNNKNDKSAKGYQELNANVSFGHDNTDSRNEVWQENYLPGTDRVWWNQRTRDWLGSRRWNASMNYDVNLDTLNSLNLNVSFGRNKSRNTHSNLGATLSDDPQRHFPDNPLDHVFGDNLPQTTRDILVNTMNELSQGRHTDNNVNVYANYYHRFRNSQHMFGLNAGYSYNQSDATDFAYYDGRYYTGMTPDEVQNQYKPGDSESWSAHVNTYFRLKVAKQLWWSIGYVYSRSHSESDNFLYRMDSLPEWTDLALHPFGSIPTPDELAAVGLNRNTKLRTSRNQQHSTYTQLSGTIGPVELSAYATYYSSDRELDYIRPGLVDTTLHRRRNYVSPSLRLRYKFSDRTSLQASYSGYRQEVGLESYINLVDDSKPQGTFAGNPDLKDGWGNNYNLNFSTYIERHELSIYAGANYGNSRNSRTNVMRYNEATGYYFSYPVNVNGNWSTGVYAGFSMALDKQKEWHLDFNANDSYSESVGYLSVGDGEDELNTIRRNFLNGRVGLSYRNKDLFVKVNAGVIQNRSRSDMQPESDETAYIINPDITLSYTTPWHMTLSTDFGLWAGRNYINRTMNTDQWVWNLSLSQKFLPEKNLILQLEATDLLHSRTGNAHSVSAYSVYTAHHNAFEPYVVLHAIYTIKWGQKKR